MSLKSCENILLHNYFSIPLSFLNIVSEASEADNPENNESVNSGIDLLSEIETPRMYHVILLNDDFTPMDFVTLVLRRFFAKTEEQAAQIMLDVHRKGSGLAGIFTFELAEMKTMQVNQFSQMHQHPLKCIMEEAPH